MADNDAARQRYWQALSASREARARLVNARSDAYRADEAVKDARVALGLTIECPYCHAEPGAPCIYPGLSMSSRVLHGLRETEAGTFHTEACFPTH